MRRACKGAVEGGRACSNLCISWRCCGLRTTGGRRHRILSGVTPPALSLLPYRPSPWRHNVQQNPGGGNALRTSSTARDALHGRALATRRLSSRARESLRSLCALRLRSLTSRSCWRGRAGSISLSAARCLLCYPLGTSSPPPPSVPVNSYMFNLGRTSLAWDAATGTGLSRRCSSA